MGNKLYLWRKLEFTFMSSVQESDHHKTIWDQRWLTALVFGLLAVVYLVNRSPYVGFNDGLSFLAATESGPDLATNATSHFLYINLLPIVNLVLLFVPTVMALTLFSVACALGALYNVYRTAQLLTPGRPGLALLPVALLGMSFTFWQQSEIIEVYAFNNLIFTSYLRLAVHDLLGGRRRHYLRISLLVGLGLLTHIQHILALPFLITYLWRGDRLRLRQKLLGMLPWMGLMSILFILPLFTQTNSIRDIFFESQFQNELLAVDPMAMLKGLALGIGMLGYCFHLGLVPIFLGWRRLWGQDKGLLGWLLLLLLPWLAFAVKYSVDDNHVFYLIPYIILVLPAGLALEQWLSTGRRGWGILLPAAFVLPVLLYASATLLAPRVPALARYDAAKAYKGGVVHLLWPGKCWAKDPLDLARQHWHGRTPDPAADHVEEWNYVTALNYLHLKG
jgi:hypothetical protein